MQLLRIVQKILRKWRGSQACSSSNLYECLCFVSQRLQMDRYDFVILAFPILLIAAVQYINPRQDATGLFYLMILILECTFLGLKRYIWPG